MGAWIVWLVLMWQSLWSSPAESSEFDTEIAPLLIKRCLECHRGTDPAGGLSLTTAAELREGGDSGPAIDPSQWDESVLLQRVLDEEMPPAKQGQPQPLQAEEAAVLTAWIKAGAKWPTKRRLDYFERTNEVRAGRDWWSLQPIRRPVVPTTSTGPSQNPIDAFIQARLKSVDAEPAPRADRRTLIKRLYHDLIGLPPTEQQIEAFVHDKDPDAWTNLIDRLLQSPHYGERWARYWLDLARYANTSGYERDQEKPFAWKYRDWVINALNNDLPYDQFVLQQLAGDEIPGRDESSVIATGFLRLGTWNDEPNDPADYQYERLEDLVHTTSSAFLGLTVKCARCHDHKFDAITQEDYYRMASVFWPGPIGTGRKRELFGGPSVQELGFAEVLGWTDLLSDPKPLQVLKDGERLKPLYPVTPGTLSAVPSLRADFKSPPPDSATSHRRLQLARWIVDPENPLMARVMVNRLWQHHFGRALVRTPNNFGFLADPPTHPELLDWLAAEFRQQGYSIKAMHRLMLTSDVWQQSSQHPDFDALQQSDPNNRLWWRAERRRLDAETLRDSLLHVSGELQHDLGGPGFKPSISPEALEGLSRKGSAWQASPASEQRRRSIYMHLKRGLLPPIMTAFDLCDPTATCGQRDVTVVPTQALAMLNHQFVHTRSQALSDAVAVQTQDRRTQVKRLWSKVLARSPNEKELTIALDFLAAQSELFRAQNNKNKILATERVPRTIDGLTLHLDSSQLAAEQIGKPIARWQDLSGNECDATQRLPAAKPKVARDPDSNRLALSFSGSGQFMPLSGSPIQGQHYTIIAVASDQSDHNKHRELLSNWNGAAGNSVTSVFLGLTGEGNVRFSDAFHAPNAVPHPKAPFILTAISSEDSAAIQVNGKTGRSAGPVTGRNLSTDWVLGQQGNIDGEYWQGLIFEIQVYDRALSQAETAALHQHLADKYSIEIETPVQIKSRSAEQLALDSLAQVLINSNEFLFVD